MTTTLESVSAEFADCINRTAPEDPTGSYFAVGTPAMRGNVIAFDEARRISKETYAQWTRRLRPVEGDLLIAREAPVGPVVRIPSGEKIAAGQRTTHIRPDPSKVDPRFLYYYLIAPETQRRLEALSMGSTVPHLRVGDVRNFELANLPPTIEQRAIGEVLGALDDKIVANRRVVDAGDALICALYSLTPKASAGRTFADVADIGGGGTPSTKSPAYWDGDVAWATPTDVTAVDGPWLARTTRSISEEGLKSCSSPLYPEGSILMTSRATIGAVVVARKPMAVNQGFIVLNAVESEMQWWLESQVRARTAEFETWANGATFLEISRGTFKRLPVLECSPEDLERFNRTAQAVRERQSSCQAENDRLACTRDELLPLLMNGRITVKDAERAAEDVL